MTPRPQPHITCICPTYKRAELLQNAIACFVLQDYPHRNLIILDDAHQHRPQTGDKWSLHVQNLRYPTLSEKFNALGDMARDYRPDIIAVWEDDDIYLPHHLTDIAASWVGGKQYFAPANAWSTYDCPRGEVQLESAVGRFHASWAYTRELWDELQGYPATDRLDFDMQMRGRAQAAAGGVNHYNKAEASYVYRWGNSHYHGSAQGEDGFRRLWDQLKQRPVPQVDTTGPKLDQWARQILKFLGMPAGLCDQCSTRLEQWEVEVCEACHTV